MKVVFKMLNIFSWIIVIGCPILIFLKIWLQYKYEKSIDVLLHRLKGVKLNYTDGIVTLAILFVVALVYLIVR